MYDLTTIGDAVFDIFIEPEEMGVICPAGKKQGVSCFEPVLCLPFGEKINIKEVHYDIGGSAANVAVGLSRQGFNIGACTAIGKDEKGREIFEKLGKENVGLSAICKISGIKSSFSIIINFKGERTILVHRGLSDYSKLKLPKNLRTKWIYLSPLGEDFETVYTKVLELKAVKNIMLALNPGNIQIKESGQVFKAILKMTKVLFLNKEEAEKLCQVRRKAQIKELLTEIKNLGPEIVIITDGSEGAYSFDGTKELKISAYSCRKKEMTGAGDAFASGVLGALLKGGDLKQALQFGVINAASAIEYIGAQTGLLTYSQIKNKIKKAPYPRPI